MMKMVNSALDLLFPWTCVVCGFNCGEIGMCRDCNRQLPWMGHACAGCALPLENDADSLCGSCQAKPLPFISARSVFEFDYPVNHLVHRFKFRRDSACGHSLSRLMAENICASLQAGDFTAPDLWVPVPMHRLRLLLRTINPAYTLACGIHRATGVELADYRLRRRRYTRTQTGLNATGRRRNLRGAFAWHGEPLKGLHVGLVDDVMTTASTMAECARVLIRAGAKQVSAWTLARALIS